MTGSAVVTVNPRPTAVLSGTNDLRWAKCDVEFGGDGERAISGTLAPGGMAFSGTGPTITVAVNPSATTTYTIATLVDGTCTAQATDMTGSAVVTVNPRPTAVLSGTNDLQWAKCDVEFGGDGERDDQRDAGPWRDGL